MKKKAKKKAKKAERAGGAFGKLPATNKAVDRWRAAIVCLDAHACMDGREKWTQQQHRQELSEACAELAEALRSEGIDESPAWAMQLRVNKGWGAEALEPFLDDVLVCLVRLQAATPEPIGAKPLDDLHRTLWEELLRVGGTHGCLSRDIKVKGLTTKTRYRRLVDLEAQGHAELMPSRTDPDRPGRQWRAIGEGPP